MTIPQETDRPLASTPLSGHLTVLDGARGLAILLVMTYHFTMGMAGQSFSSRLLFKLTSVGWCGVNLFFVLSGFLITGILYDTRTSVHRFRNFYMRRALRIFPLYYGTLLILFGLIPWMNRWTHGFQGVERAWPWLWSYGTNILISLDGKWFPLSHYWSLAVEEHFYLIWPLFVFTLDRRSSIRACLALIAIALVVRFWLVGQGLVLSAYTLTLSRMDGLAIGALVALSIRGEHGLGAIVPLARKGAKFCGAALVMLMLWRLGLRFHDALVQTLGYLLLDLFFACLIVVLVVTPQVAPLARFFNLGVLRSLGRYSYGIYVYNSIFILVADGLSVPSRVAAWTDSVAVERLVYVALATVSTLSMAWLSWHLLEKHFLKLKVHFESRPIVSVE
ncbi:Peptidoglycan/LPS O-acetylase OafA/YrhL, contains acyltransferase and SGNH-hydrolase domains [Singulisphaera sp. GP187]|uniref:acyltransferase family protein n=1 Tax=Singulisphaera sp. GP187 TaxID=1882752 RepID=UPI00092CB0D6|nr:acyltransferase [Singulisphaera sp. GP187]SIO62464.1 Peptidoglycan/LPS O-acetylase OafA/YrhL, contains acyltransferase and SGNH-hydrolase domains [Singulisphaera sp. GP187]